MSISIKNSTNTPLDNNQRWTGEIEDVSKWESVTINYISDTSNNVLTVQYSVDGNSFQDYNIVVGLEYIENIPLVAKYIRVKFLNDSGSDQTFLRIQTLLKNQVTDIQVSGSVTVEPGTSSLDVAVTNNSLLVSNGLKPYEFIPTPYNSTPEIYADAEQPNITAYGTWNFTNNVGGYKVNWYLYRTLKQTDLSLDSIKSCYMVIENKSGSTAWPYLALYSLPDGYGDAQAWYKSKWVFENSNEVFDLDERLLLYFGDNPENVEPEIRHINLPINNVQSAGPRLTSEQIGLIALNTDSAQDTGAYNFDLTKFGINWYSSFDNASGQKPNGIQIQNDLSELVVSVSPSPSNALKPYRNINVGLTASLIKLGPCWLHTINKSNDDNNHLFLKLYSSSTAPIENDTPVWTVRVHQNQSNDINFNVPLYSELGFWVRCSTGVADDDIGEPSANGCICNIAYC